MSDFSAWIGRESLSADFAAAAPLRGLAALLDRPDRDPQILPPLAHWLFFLPDAPQSRLGADGHPRLGDAMPDFGLPRRMWAGSRIAFHAPIAIGAPIHRRSRIESIALKEGASGPLAFVTLRHEIRTGGGTAIVEEQDIVYRRAAGGPGAGGPSGAKPEAEPPPIAGDAILRERAADPVLLFRFSALTFNAHRIHYDRDYAREVEGYAGLVVHGPLQAMLLIDLYRTAFPEREITGFSFRAEAPLLEGERAAFGLEPDAQGGALWVRAAGRRTMSATISARAPAPDNRPDRT